MEPVELCAAPLKCLYEFQGLASGLLAIVAALGTAYVIWRSAILLINAERSNLEEHQNRLLNFYCRKLSEDLRLIADRARHTEGTIKVQIASQKDLTDNIRERTILSIPDEFNNPDIMSLFSTQLAKKIMNLHRLLQDHNFDMRRAGGAFGANNFQQSIFERMNSIISRSQSLSVELEAKSKAYFQTE